MENNESSFAGDESSEAVSQILEQADKTSEEVEAGAEQEVEASSEENEEQEVKKEDPLSRKFAALSRREKSLKQREQEINSRMQELEEKLKAQETPQEPQVNIEDLLRKDPLKALETSGYDLNTLAEIALQDGKLPVDLQMKLMQEELEKKYNSKFEELEAKQIEEAKKKEEMQYNQAIENFKEEINSHVTSDLEKYELINSSENIDLVYDTIVEHHETTKDESGNGEILEVAEAAELVEQYLLEKAQQMLKANKLKAMLDGSKKEPVKQKVEQNQESVTLTNRASSQNPSNGVKELMSEEESLQEAAKLIKWYED
jgi:hypothetical protein